MRASQCVEVLCSIPAEEKIIVLRDVINPVRQKSKKICVVVNDRQGAISLCIFSCVQKKNKNGRNRIFPIPFKAEKICVMITQQAGKNPRGKKRKNIKIKFI